jgi:uncharacterized protein
LPNSDQSVPEPNEGLPTELEGLMHPDAYPHPVNEVRLIATHISWLLLTGSFVYKIKRPVLFPFVDLRSAQRRAFLCAEEIRLNRRFAPEIYLGVCNITSDERGAMIGGKGAVIERAVKMVQFQSGEELDALLVSRRIEAAELREFGDQLAQIHASLPSAGPASVSGSPQAVRAAIIRNWAECLETARRCADAEPLLAIRSLLEDRLERIHDWLTQRLATGRIKECHGDLHCSNVVRVESRLRAFDCLEFDTSLRWIDVADEVAFLVADLQAVNCPRHAQAFLQGYLDRSGDYSACKGLRLYAAHRSLVRAKVVALTSLTSGVRSSFERARTLYDSHLRCAQGYLSSGKRPVLMLMSGLPGSGKTWLAQQLAPRHGAIHLRSDIERKRLAQLEPSSRSASGIGQGIYSPEISRRLQEHLLRSADLILAGGFSAIVDASFSLREHRLQFAALARDLGVSGCIVHCHAPLSVLESRIQQRARAGSDASEADIAVLEWQLSRYEPVEADGPLQVFSADTSEASVFERLSNQLDAFAGPLDVPVMP